MNRKTMTRMLLGIMLLIMVLSTPVRASLAETFSSAEIQIIPKASNADTIEAKKDKQLKPGGKGSYVTWFQKRLKKLGYYEDKITNVYNAQTKQATKEFQQINGLPVTGIGDKATRTKAFDKSAITRAKYDEDNFLTELKRGKKGDQVKQLQQRLIEYGYLSEANSNYDDATVNAVKFFQAAHGMKATGVATRAMRQFINAGVNIVHYNTFAATESQASAKKGDWGLRVGQIQERLKALGYYSGKIDYSFSSDMSKAVILFKQFNNITPANGDVTKANRAQIDQDTALSYAKVNGPDTLKPGNKGAAVLILQCKLKDLKYYKGALNRSYTSAVKTAVKKFQQANKQYPSGIAYSPTLALLAEKISLDTSINPKACKIRDTAIDQLGKPYKSRAMGPKSFDCSGFTYYVYKEAKVGVTLKDSAAAQGSDSRGKIVASREDILPGDLLFFATGSSKTKLNHVGICYSVDDGNIKFIHASSAQKKVISSAFKDDSNSNFYESRFLFARRMLK